MIHATLYANKVSCKALRANAGSTSMDYHSLLASVMWEKLKDLDAVGQYMSLLTPHDLFYS